jgi:hypothetical protein
MFKKLTVVMICVLMVFGGVPSLQAGGRLETVDITGNVPSPIAGHTIAKVIGIEWDRRSIPVQYSMNTSLAVIPNPIGAAFLTPAQAQVTLQESFDEWNAVPTSFIDMRITGTTANAGLVGFDFVNELSFRTANAFGAIASSPSVSLISDSTFVDGDHIDGDADPDVSSAITTAADVDGDGDIEFPAGVYKAGTILDNDVQFNTKTSNGFRFTVDPAAADTNTRSVDLKCVAVHEFGHSFGLSHSMNNQKNAVDGTAATMFPFIDTGDPASEASGRTIDSDDIAWSSYIYPEGSTTSGPAALQAGDIAFDSAYGLITGSVHHGLLNQPIAGAAVHAIQRGSKTAMVSAFSGTTQVSRSANGSLFLISPEFNILDGNYAIPVPKGNYEVSVEAVDGSPVAAGSISLTAQIGSIFGQHNFNEEFWNHNKEGVLEVRPGQNKNASVNAGKTTSAVNITTNSTTLNINNFQALASIGFINSPGGRMYAMRVPAAQINAILPGQNILVQGALFDTHVVDASEPVVFAEAMLTRGTANADGSVTIDLANPLQQTSEFVAQDGDFAPFYFKNPHDLGMQIRQGLADGTIQDLFMVLRIPQTPFPGISAQPPLVGFSTATPIIGLSYLSSDGGVTWVRQTTRDFRFSLMISATP